jgi:hypothetical protein
LLPTLKEHPTSYPQVVAGIHPSLFAVIPAYLWQESLSQKIQDRFPIKNVGNGEEERAVFPLFDAL